MAALLALLVLLAGPPLLLVKVVGWPVRGVPTADQFRDWVAQPLTEGTLTVGLTLLAWLIWLFVAYTVTVAVAQRVRSGARWLRRLPLPTPLQATATGVAGAAVFGTGHAAVAAPPQPPAPVTATTLNGSPIGPDLGAAAAKEVGEGVTVQGGWLPRGTAEQVAAASVLVWLRRRRDYQPLTTSGPQHDDLTPLPPTVAAVRAAIDVPHASAAGNSQLDQAAPARQLTLLPQTVALTGPGARCAGRGVLVTALLAALRHPADATPVVITRTALTMLLGAHPPALHQGLAGLRVTASIDEALTLADGAGHKMTLISETVSASAAARLAAALKTPTVTAVVLGSSPAGSEWHVDVDGYAHDAGRPQQAGPRLCVLDQVAAIDLLAVLTHTQPPPTRPAADTAAVPRPRPPADPVTAHATTTPARETPPPAQLRILGKPTLLIDGQPVTIRRSAAWQALILLAVHPDGLRTRQLTDAIWPGVPAHTVTGRLYTTISELRRTVAAIDHADDRYRLEPAQVDIDLWHLRTAAHRAVTALIDHTSAWQAVIDSYTGDLAAGHTWAWIDQAREATRRLVIDAYAAAAGAQTDPHRALELLEAALRVDPYNAHLHRRAAHALTAIGDHTGAAELLHTYTHRLAHAGLPPEPIDQAVPTRRSC